MILARLSRLCCFFYSMFSETDIEELVEHRHVDVLLASSQSSRIRTIFVDSRGRGPRRGGNCHESEIQEF